MQISTPALIIKVMDIRENDRLVTLLTKNLGVVKAFVSGAKKVGHKNHAATSLFCYSDLLLTRSGDTYKVKDAALISSFFNLSSNIENLALAQYFCELTATLSPEETPADEQLRLVLNTLNFLCKGNMDNTILKSIFEMRTMVITGYMPNLLACSECGKFDDEIMFFSIENGEICCNNCKPVNTNYLLNQTLLSALRHIVYSDFSKLFNFSIPHESAKQLNKITENYLIYQTDRQYNTLNFYKSII